jgi:NhaA family Na+:H+ antiporter
MALLVAAVILAALIVLNWSRVRHPLPYTLLGIGLWLAFLESGMHPTIAGVLLAMTIPARAQIQTEAYMAQCTAALGGLRSGAHGEESRQQQAAAQTLEVIAERIQTPLQRMERALNPWVAYLIVPVFAFANAGVALGGNLAETLTSPIFLGIVGGLVLGKALGITIFSWIAVKIGVAGLPFGVNWRQLFASSWLAGIGFTMSLFIANSAFDSAALLSIAKISILTASLLAAGIGFVLVILTSPAQEGLSQLEPASATS